MAQGNVWYKDVDGWHPCVANRVPYNYSWSSTEWGPCSVECGGGVQERTITCVDGNGNTVDDSFCIAQLGPKPDEIRDCNTQVCIDCRYAFQGRTIGQQYPNDRWVSRMTVYPTYRFGYVYRWDGVTIGHNPTVSPSLGDPGMQSDFYVNSDGFVYYLGEFREQVIPNDTQNSWTMYSICRQPFPDGLTYTFSGTGSDDSFTTGWRNKYWSGYHQLVRVNGITILDHVTQDANQVVQQITYGGVLYSMGPMRSQINSAEGARNTLYNVASGADPRSVMV